jgi:hypothetical protein
LKKAIASIPEAGIAMPIALVVGRCARLGGNPFRDHGFVKPGRCQAAWCRSGVEAHFAAPSQGLSLSTRMARARSPAPARKAPADQLRRRGLKFETTCRVFVF